MAIAPVKISHHLVTTLRVHHGSIFRDHRRIWEVVLDPSCEEVISTQSDRSILQRTV